MLGMSVGCKGAVRLRDCRPCTRCTCTLAPVEVDPPMKNTSIALVAVAALCTGLAASASARIDSGELCVTSPQRPRQRRRQDRVDFSVIEKIRAEGMERSKILETFDYLVTAIGPRLTNSPAHKRAIAWTQEQMKAIRPERGPRRAVAVRPRLDAQQGHDRDGRAALHAADRISAGLVAVDRRTHRRDAGVDAGPRRRGDESAGRKTQGRHPVHEPDPAVRDSRRSSRRQRRSETARSASRRSAAAQRRAARDAEGRRRRRGDPAEHRRARHVVRDRARSGRQRGAVDHPRLRALQPGRADAAAEDPGEARRRDPGDLQRGRSQHAQRDRRDSRHRQRDQGRDRDGRRAPRLVAHRHRRNRQRRRLARR